MWQMSWPCYNLLLTAVGVTDEINQNQLLAFASDRQYVMKIQSFSELPITRQLSVNAMLALCGRVTVSEFTRTPSIGSKCLVLPRVATIFVTWMKRNMQMLTWSGFSTCKAHILSTFSWLESANSLAATATSYCYTRPSYPSHTT